MSKEETTTTKPPAEKKRRNPLLIFLKVLGIILLLLVLALAAWIVFSGLNKKSSLSLIPSQYGVYLHTDSVWEAVNPLLDLQAAEILLATKEFSSLRPVFIALRQSQLRNNKLLELVASRPVDVGLYLAAQAAASGTTHTTPDSENGILGGNHFVAVVDMGFFSAATRLAKLWVQLLPLEGITLVQGSDGHHFELATANGTIYFTNHSNTLIASSSKALFQQALLGNNDALYSPQELELLERKTGNPIQIIADARALAQSATEGTPSLSQLTGLIHQQTKALVSFGITDQEVKLKLDIPLELEASLSTQPQLTGLHSILQQNSSLPLLLSQLGSNTQYYTIMNLGSLAQLKEAAFPLLPKKLDAENLWNTANSLSTNFFGVDLQELLFSWAGGEFGLLGVEGLKDPAIALEIKDENMRQFIFNQLLSSIILKDDTSLILNGVRLPRLQFPVFIQGLMKMLNINMPSPYYMVHKGFIYFSQSPETLSAIFTSMQSGQRLSSNQGWSTVAKDHHKETSVGIFYDLEQGTPFFLRGDNVVVQILELYSTGLLNVQLQNDSLVCQLSAAARPSGQLRTIPGFPMALEGTAAQVHKIGGKDSRHLFWVENSTVLKVLDLSSMTTIEKTFRSPILVAPAKSTSKEDAIWAVTAEGAVYLLTASLTDRPNFPLLTSSNPGTQPAATEQGLVQPMDDDSICFVGHDGTFQKVQLELAGSIMTAPSLMGQEAAFYDKGFSGSLLVMDTKSRQLVARQQVFGIAYGSPSLMENQRDTYLGFITQAGRLSLWRFTNETDATGMKKLEQVADTSLTGVFFTNLTSNGKHFFALSAEGQLFRISPDGSWISVQIPNSTARNGVITVIPDAKTGAMNIYAGVDGNVLYGFNDNLELLQGFPLAGSGVPVLVDANGDGREDCIALTIDNKLNGWNLR